MDTKKELEQIKRYVVEIINEDELLEKLERSRKEKKPLRIKLGLDPNRPDVHLGHTVVLRTLRLFQDMGHTAVLIIGDYTAMIGDPSGRSATRPALTHEEVVRNCKTYEEQVFKILRRDRTEMVRNGDWFSKLTFDKVLHLASLVTVARLLERDDFEERLKNKEPLSLHEVLYPVMQGYDSVIVKSDVELGGTDQKFNNLMGRTLQKALGQEPQTVITFPLLEGTDGQQKMSKSLGNYIGLTDPPAEMFGKVMSIPDTLIIKYLDLVTDLPVEEVRKKEQALKSGKENPMDLKKWLAGRVVEIYHGGAKAGQEAREAFESTFQKKVFPEDAPKCKIPRQALDAEGKIWVIQMLVLAKLAPSKTEARRLVEQGAVILEGQPIKDQTEAISLKKPLKVQVGKRRFAVVEAE